jgi:tetratricopeptide (TPR) repeat protein
MSSPRWSRISIVLLIALGTGAVAHAFQTPQLHGIARLQAWQSAVDAHRPGSLDQPLLQFAEWSRDDLEALFVDALALLDAIKNPGRRSARPSRDFTASDVEALVMLATVENQRDVNRVAHRAALFHTDLARFFPPASAAAVKRGSGDPGIAPRRSTAILEDGTPRATGSGALHWDFARQLLDAVTPDPAADPWVRSWYQATAALFAVDHQYSEAVPHFKRARQLFPRDAVILTDIGCFYEALAAPRIQDAMQVAVLPDGVKFEVAAELPNLHQAADAFRQAVAADAGSIEARLRLGRVTGLLGDHEAALSALRQVRQDSRDAKTSYYAALFAGAEEQTLGRFDDARRSFERAATLYPRAQSPQFALSQVAWLSGDSDGALRLLQASLRPGAPPSAADDPWSEYFDGLGGTATALLGTLLTDFERNEAAGR